MWNWCSKKSRWFGEIHEWADQKLWRSTTSEVVPLTKIDFASILVDRLAKDSFLQNRQMENRFEPMGARSDLWLKSNKENIKSIELKILYHIFKWAI